jgi:hypothetical protein
VRIGLIALSISMLASCAATTPHMIPTPVAYKHPSLDLLPALRPELRTTEVPQAQSMEVCGRLPRLHRRATNRCVSAGSTYDAALD